MQQPRVSRSGHLLVHRLRDEALRYEAVRTEARQPLQTRVTVVSMRRPEKRSLAEDGCHTPELLRSGFT